MIQIEHLNKTYVSRQGETHIALTDINLTIEDGSVFGIIGQSGAGKSTLVRCLNLLERPTSGSIIINGRDITSLSEKELREFPQLGKHGLPELQSASAAYGSSQCHVSA